MKIAVLGTGAVGRALASKLAELGHNVTVGTRDVVATMARREPDRGGDLPFAMWAAANETVNVATFTDAAAGAELIVNATPGAASMAVLEAAGPDNLIGKIVLDVANPLDFSAGFPPTLFVQGTDSLGEQIQTAFPTAKVVKALNTMNASVMVNPRHVADGDHSVFVSGNDAEAKATVIALLSSLGHMDVIDLGDITTARGPEMILPIWLRLVSALGTSSFNFKIAR